MRRTIRLALALVAIVATLSPASSFGASTYSGVEDHAGSHFRVAFLPEHAAATATEEIPVFFAWNKVQILDVFVVPGAAITGADTNTTHLNLIDRDGDGTGTSEKGNIDFTSGVNGTKSDAKTLYSNSTGFELAAGDVLSIEIEKVGTGLLLPEMQVVIRYLPK